MSLARLFDRTNLPTVEFEGWTTRFAIASRHSQLPEALPMASRAPFGSQAAIAAYTDAAIGFLPMTTIDPA